MHKNLISEGAKPACGKVFVDFTNWLKQNFSLFTTHYSRLTQIAFTLAETLIVIGIIGVVAALTLPNLNHATGDKEKVTRVKKIYSALTEAIDRAQAIYGTYDEWAVVNGAYDEKRVGERITEFMKISKTCEDSDKGCFTSGNLKYLGNNDSLINIEDEPRNYRVVTADGTSVVFDFHCMGSNYVIVDLDGPNKGSYTVGKDVFVFNISDVNGEYMLMPNGYDLDFEDLLSDMVKTDNSKVYATWVINYDNMDYLKFNNGKCPNGTVPTESNPRCN